jgi:hypothetical protein
MRRFTLPLFLVLVAACDSPFGPDDEGVTFVVEAASFSIDEMIRGELRNESQDGIGYNLCFSGFELKQGRSWTPAAPLHGFGIACATIQLGLAPGRSAPFAVRLPAGLTSGTYRIATEVETPKGRSERVTRPFLIR